MRRELCRAAIKGLWEAYLRARELQPGAASGTFEDAGVFCACELFRRVAGGVLPRRASRDLGARRGSGLLPRRELWFCCLGTSVSAKVVGAASVPELSDIEDAAVREAAELLIVEFAAAALVEPPADVDAFLARLDSAFDVAAHASRPAQAEAASS